MSSNKNLTLGSLKAHNIIVDNIRGGSTTTAGFEAVNTGTETFPAAPTALWTNFPTVTLQGFDYDNAGVFTCHVKGRYRVDWVTRAVALTVASTGRIALEITRNSQALLGGTFDFEFENAATSTTSRGMTFPAYFNADPGDTIRFNVFNGTGQSAEFFLTRMNCVRFSDSTA